MSNLFRVIAPANFKKGEAINIDLDTAEVLLTEEQRKTHEEYEALLTQIKNMPQQIVVGGKSFYDESDAVNHPSHYNTGRIEVIEFIEDQNLTYHVGNTVKYLCRAGKKDPAKFVEDLEKAEWYLRRFVELAKSSREGREPKRPNQMVAK